MRVFVKALSVLFAFLLLTALGAPPALAEAPESGSVRILFTHDIHASLEPAQAADESGRLYEAGGFARLTAAIHEARAAAPGSTLLVDAGDYTMGTLFQAVETAESPELRLMGMMGYDAVTVGNHEFDYTITGITDSLNAAAGSGEPLPAYVMSNISLPEGDPKADALRAAMDAYGVTEYTVVEKNGVRIGIFGVLGDEAADLAPMSAPAAFGDIKECAERMVKLLREQEQADLIVCLSHSGTKENIDESEDEQLAKAVPGIDVIVSGHTHTILQQPIVVGSTVIVSCGADSAFLGTLDLVRSGGGWQVQGYSLRPVGSSLAEDEAVAEKVSYFKTLVNEYLADYDYTFDEVIAYSPYQYTNINDMYYNPGDYALGDITADSYVYAVQQAEGGGYETVDLAVVPMGTLRATINKGDVTVADAFKILSLGTGPDGLTGYPLISVYLYGWELQNVCEVDASVSGLMGDAQLFIAGLQYTYNPRRLIFDKVIGAQLTREDGSAEAIGQDRLYRVVCSLYSGQMLAYVKEKSFGILSITPKDETGTEITDYNDQIIYTQGGRELKEWQAVVSYLSSFEKQNGVSTIPEAYAAPQGRKTADTSGGIFGILSHPNTFAWIVYGIVIVLLAVIALAVVLIVRGTKKRKARRAAKAVDA
jgi:2',3'-cyclic-nucleotide 2'-phosphodiesterase (5'-nucleotidase family)